MNHVTIPEKIEEAKLPSLPFRHLQFKSQKNNPAYYKFSENIDFF